MKLSYLMLFILLVACTPQPQVQKNVDIFDNYPLLCDNIPPNIQSKNIINDSVSFDGEKVTCCWKYTELKNKNAEYTQCLDFRK